jgi:hypothetical protein
MCDLCTCECGVGFVAKLFVHRVVKLKATSFSIPTKSATSPPPLKKNYDYLNIQDTSIDSHI